MQNADYLLLGATYLKQTKHKHKDVHLIIYKSASLDIRYFAKIRNANTKVFYTDRNIELEFVSFDELLRGKHQSIWRLSSLSDKQVIAMLDSLDKREWDIYDDGILRIFAAK